MKNRILYLAFFAFFVVKSAEISAQPLSAKEYETLILNAVENNISPKKYLLSQPYSFKRDVGNFDIRSGQLILATLKNGFQFALFTGEGTFSFTPPLESEKKQLFQFCGKEQYAEDFKAATFLCLKGSALPIPEHAEAQSLSEREHENVKKNIRNFFAQTIGTGKNYGLFDIIELALNQQKTDQQKTDQQKTDQQKTDQQKTDFFYGDCLLKNGDNVLWTITPDDKEQVQFSKLKNSNVLYGNYWKEICQFPATSQKNSQSPGKVEISHYRIDFNFTRSLDATLTMTIDYNLKEPMQWLPLFLDARLKVRSVKTSDGKDLAFFREQERWELIIRLDSLTSASGNGKLTIVCDGAIVDRYKDFTFVRTSSFSWYPVYSHAFTAKSTFDVTFHVPDNYVFQAVGDKISEEKQGGMVISRWKADKPMRNYSFNIGPFYKKQGQKEGIPDVTMLHVTSSMESEVFGDLQGSLEFYTKLFGALPFKQIVATEFPANGGAEAFPGLIHLPHYVFGNFNDAVPNGTWEGMVAHEVAHQWWAIGVDYATSRDRWLSEGFAEYSSRMYVQATLKDKKAFLNQMEKSRKNLIEKLVSGDKQMGIISLAHRNRLDNDKSSYFLVVYEKGAWVLHMLRNMLLKLNTMDESVFMNTMKEFYAQYKGKEASTEDFRRVAEKNAGMDLKWFFDQWVDGASIPKYHFSYKTTKTPEGKFQVICRVRTERVAESFQMSVPISIDFGGDKSARVRSMVKGSFAEFKLPLLPLEPKEITFNAFNSVLCELETEKWDDSLPVK